MRLLGDIFLLGMEDLNREVRNHLHKEIFLKSMWKETMATMEDDDFFTAMEQELEKKVNKRLLFT
jgi:hypothetical protein